MNILDQRFFDSCCDEYLNYITRLIQSGNFNLNTDQQCLQYFLSALHINHLDSNRDLYRNMIGKGKKYLVLGSGCGYLERAFYEDNNASNVVGADWKITDIYFDWWRKKLSVSDLITHHTEDLLKNFRITHKETDDILTEKFDVVMLVRFNGLWRENNNFNTIVRPYDEVMNFFKNLKTYAPIVGIHAAGLSRKLDNKVIDFLEKNVIKSCNGRGYYSKLISIKNL